MVAFFVLTWLALLRERSVGEVGKVGEVGEVGIHAHAYREREKNITVDGEDDGRRRVMMMNLENRRKKKKKEQSRLENLFPI